MGDQCSVNLTFRNKRDANKFKQITGEDWQTIVEDNEGVEAVFDDCNDAMVDALMDVAETGLEFYGNHGAGDYYPRESIVAWKGELDMIPLDIEGFETVRVIFNDATGGIEVNQDDIIRTRDHMWSIRMLKRKWAKAKPAKSAKKKGK
jgi:hypothetical protein